MDLALALVELGRLFAVRGKIDEAMRCFARSIRIDRTYASAYFAAGDVLYDCGSYWEAASEYRDGLIYNPRNADGFAALGNCYLQVGEYPEAAVAFRQALILQPDLREAEDALGALERRTLKRAA